MQSSGTMFGPNWPNNMEYPRLGFTLTGCAATPNGDCVPRSVAFTQPDGTIYTYTWIGWTDDGNFYTYRVNGASATGDLVYVAGSKWILKRNNVNYTYNNTGYIQTISEAKGYGAVLTFSYTGTQLTKITNSVGQWVGFTWTGPA